MSTPFMQLYVGDYLGDTRHLTTEQHGAYLLLLMSMWRADGTVPNDDAKLARLTGLSQSRWQKLKPEIMDLMIVAGGRVSQKRLWEEFEKAREKSRKRSSAGHAGGVAKALKDKGGRVANAGLLPRHSPEPESEPEEKKNTPPPKRPVQPSLLADASDTPGKVQPGEFDAFYAAFPRRVGRGDAERAYAKARKIATAEILLRGARAYAVVRAAEDAKFTLHPATWLNGKRWLDEAAPHAGASTSAMEDQVSDRLWTQRLEAFYHGSEDWEVAAGYWQAKWGPPPPDPACKATPESRKEYHRLHPARIVK